MKITTVTEQVIIDNLVQDIKTNRVKWKWVLNVKEGVALFLKYKNEADAQYHCCCIRIHFCLQHSHR